MAAEWWRALLLFAATTGWRIGAMLALRSGDMDFDTGSVLARAEDNKGKRDLVDRLPMEVSEAMRRVAHMDGLVFAWPHPERSLYREFHRIQAAAGIRLSGKRSQEHACDGGCVSYYSFHAIRRMFATLNASRLPAPVLQRKMRHKDITTTLGYIQVAEMMEASAAAVYVPPVEGIAEEIGTIEAPGPEVATVQSDATPYT